MDIYLDQDRAGLSFGQIICMQGTLQQPSKKHQEEGERERALGIGSRKRSLSMARAYILGAAEQSSSRARITV